MYCNAIRKIFESKKPDSLDQNAERAAYSGFELLLHNGCVFFKTYHGWELTPLKIEDLEIK